MMKIYPLFLLAIIVTCQAKEVSWSRQMNAYSGHRKNDLNQEAYLDEGGGRSDRSIGRTAYNGSVYVIRTRDLNDDVKRAGNPTRGDNVRTPSTLVVGKLPTKSSGTGRNAWKIGQHKGSDVARASGQARGVPDKNYKATLTKAHKDVKDLFVWNQARFDDAASDGHAVRQTRSLEELGVSDVNQATFVSRTNKLGQGANVLRSSNLNRASSYGQENYLNRVDGLSQADYARRNLGAPGPVAQGLNVERTSYFGRSAPIMRAENYGPYNWIHEPRPDVTKSEPKNVISTSDSIRPEAQMSRHGYSHPDPEIERKQREQYVPSLLDIAERSAIEDSNKNYLDSTYKTKDINLPTFDLVDDYSLLSDTYGNPIDGYDAPYDGYETNNGSDISYQGLSNGYGGLDYNTLAPDFDNFRDSDVNSITKNKITTSALIAVYNDSTAQNIYNNTDQKTISDRGGFFNDDKEYTLDHRGFHNAGTMFSDDSTNNDGTPDVVEISSNNALMNSYGDCYCSTNNGHRTCNCDLKHCQGENCHRVPQTQTTTTTCELCKARETTTLKPYVCDICHQPPPPPHLPSTRCDGHCEPCRLKCDPCRQRESSCEYKQSCSCGCNCCKCESCCCSSESSCCCRSESSCCKHSSSNCCKHCCHSCKPKRPSCNNCESGQDFRNNYGDNANNNYGENGHNYYGDIAYNAGAAYNRDNSNNAYNAGAAYNRDNSNNAYNDYYNNYYKNQAAAAFGGNAGDQFHSNFQGNEYVGAYAGGGGQITGGGKSATEQSGSSGGTVALYADTDLDDAPISSSKSSNAGSSMSSVAGSRETKGSGSKSSSSASAYSSSTSYGGGGGGGNPYNHLFNSLSKAGIFPINPMMNSFGK